MSNPHGQGDYQVRFDWGTAGAETISHGARLLLWVDQLPGEPAPESPIDSMTVTMDDAAEVARRCLHQQTELGGRFVIAVVAAGAVRPDGSLRFAVEDLLAAGAIIDALAGIGIDHQSPEAAAAAAAYLGLKNATRHLISASASSREARESSTPGVG